MVFEIVEWPVYGGDDVNIRKVCCYYQGRRAADDITGETGPGQSHCEQTVSQIFHLSYEATSISGEGLRKKHHHLFQVVRHEFPSVWFTLISVKAVPNPTLLEESVESLNAFFKGE